MSKYVSPSVEKNVVLVLQHQLMMMLSIRRNPVIGFRSVFV